MKINDTKILFLISRLRSLKHPINKEILSLLELERRKCVGDLQKKLKIGQPEVSHYLTDMKRKGILKSKREGQNIYYFINMPVYEQLKEYLQNMID